MGKFTKPIVFINLPRAGLGNKLIVWAHGINFSEKNNLNNYVFGWFNIKIGPFLRNEKRKRLYFGFFKKTKYDLLFFYKMLFFKKIYNPNYFSKNDKVVYIFDTLPIFPNYLVGLENSRDLIRKQFFKILNPKHLNYLSNFEFPILSVHIRRSDFKKNDNLDIGSVCNTQTPLIYFKEKISEIREASDSLIPVTVFTDGKYDEISDLLLIKNVILAKDNLDIIDLLLMANSKYLIISPGSTFSLWANFISNSELK
jgi:hypothetical protein